MIYNLSEYYGIIKYNKNANKLTYYANGKIDTNLHNFYNELFFYEYKIKQIIKYLLYMFN